MVEAGELCHKSWVLAPLCNSLYEGPYSGLSLYIYIYKHIIDVFQLLQSGANTKCIRSYTRSAPGCDEI